VIHERCTGQHLECLAKRPGHSLLRPLSVEGAVGDKDMTSLVLGDFHCIFYSNKKTMKIK